jgi:hypothetical protein
MGGFSGISGILRDFRDRWKGIKGIGRGIPIPFIP